MRLPLLPILFVLALNLVIDFYLYRRLKTSCKNQFWSNFQKISAIAFNLIIIIVICTPKAKGGEASLERLMWALYAYFSIYIPKLLFTIIALVAALPTLWHKKRINPLSAIGAVFGVAIFIIMWWGALINRYNIDVRHVDITIGNLPPSFDGFTIAQFSDLHTGSFGQDTSFVNHLVETVNNLKPDLIVFTGDIVNRRSPELVPFVTTLSKLTSPNGVLSILGNHDYGDYYVWKSDAEKRSNLDELKTLQSAMGWKLLNNETAFIRRNNDSIAIIGVENVGDPPFHTYGDLDKAYPSLDDPTTKILLSHNPAHWDKDIKDSPDKNIALTLSGHTHAMQMSAFGKSPASLRYPTWGGLYHDDDLHQLYVNIGAGEVGIPARIGATPEITLITLRK